MPNHRGYSTVKIEDQFSQLNISRQRKYQMRNRLEGLCIICGDAAYEGTLFCYDCNIKRGIQHPGKNKKAARFN